MKKQTIAGLTRQLEIETKAAKDLAVMVNNLTAEKAAEHDKLLEALEELRRTEEVNVNANRTIERQGAQLFELKDELIFTLRSSMRHQGMEWEEIDKLLQTRNLNTLGGLYNDGSNDITRGRRF